MKILELEIVKREYVSPTILVETIELENGITANSAVVSPSVTSGSADPVPTDWNTSNDTTLYPEI
ncbi:hypothetical protein [Elizabethkingia anophelis]|uniref:hypothetical protein n=1 Tax=Elizabethkingia anophelis TaxID=1117645 RepID=UPI0038925E3A